MTFELKRDSRLIIYKTNFDGTLSEPTLDMSLANVSDSCFDFVSKASGFLGNGNSLPTNNVSAGNLRSYLTYQC